MKITKEDLDRLSFSIDEETYYTYDNIVDEIADTEEDISVNVGESIKQYHSTHMDINYFIEQMCNSAYDTVGEIAETYLDEVTKEHKKELENIIQDYLNKVAGEPRFWAIGRTEEITKQQFLDIDFEFDLKES